MTTMTSSESCSMARTSRWLFRSKSSYFIHVDATGQVAR